MYKTSEAWKTAMAQDIRNQGYAKVKVYMLDSARQYNSVVTSGGTDISNVLENLDVFPEPVDIPGTITVDVADSSASLKGFTLVFHKGYEPTSFTISFKNSAGSVIYSESAIGLGEWSVSKDLSSVKTITITGTAGSKLDHIIMGKMLEYTVDDLITISSDRTFSPICAELPQIDTQIVLSNDSGEFDVDNPHSVIKQFNISTTVSWAWGYELDIETEEIEWIQGGIGRLNDWDSNPEELTLNVTESIRNVDAVNDSMDTVESEVMKELDIPANLSEIGTKDLDLETKFKVDCYYDDSLKEALQKTTNAKRGVLYYDRHGSLLNADSDVISNTGNYSRSLFTMSKKTEFATRQQNYASVDGLMTFESDDNTVDLGYVVNNSDASGNVNLDINVSDFAPLSISSVVIDFAHSNIETFTITLGTYTFTQADFTEYNPLIITREDIERKTGHPSIDIDSVRIQVNKTSSPNNPVVIHSIYLSPRPVYREVLTQDDYMDDLNVVRQEEVVSLTEKIYYTTLTSDYDPEDEEEGTSSPEGATFSSKDSITLNLNETKSFITDSVFMYRSGDPNCLVRMGAAQIEGVNLTQTGWTSFDLELTNVTATGVLEVVAYNVENEEYPQTFEYRASRNSGNAITFDNPFMDLRYKPEGHLNWLYSQYYSSPFEFTFSTRGMLEYDPGDILYLETKYGNVLVVITQQNITFNGAFSGTMTARMIGG